MTYQPLIPLSRVLPGTSVCVRHIGLTGGICRRLLDLGLIEGTVITPLQISPSGDPTAYFIRGTVIALRRRDAEHILVEPVPKSPQERKGCRYGRASATPGDRAGGKSERRKKHRF